MLEKSVGENSVVDKSVVAKLCREVSEKSDPEKFWIQV